MRGDTRGRDYKGTKKLGVVKVIDAQVATKVSGGDGGPMQYNARDRDKWIERRLDLGRIESVEEVEISNSVIDGTTPCWRWVSMGNIE